MASSHSIRQVPSSPFNPVLLAALEAAKSYVPPPPRCTADEAEAGVRRAQELFRASNLVGHDLVDELIEGRRAEAARE